MFRLNMSKLNIDNAPMIHCPNLKSFINLYLAFMRGGPNQELANTNYVRYLRVKVPRDATPFQKSDTSVNPDFEGDLYFVAGLSYKSVNIQYTCPIMVGNPMAIIYLCTSEFDVFSSRSYYAERIDDTGTYMDYSLPDIYGFQGGPATYLDGLEALIARVKLEIHQQSPDECTCITPRRN